MTRTEARKTAARRGALIGPVCRAPKACKHGSCAKIRKPTRDVRSNPTNQAGVYKTTEDYLKFMRRMANAAAKRVGEMDPDALAVLVEVIEDMKRVELDAAEKIKAAGYSWTDIGNAQGTTRQTAQRKYGNATGRGASRKGTYPSDKAIAELIDAAGADVL